LHKRDFLWPKPGPILLVPIASRSLHSGIRYCLPYWLPAGCTPFSSPVLPCVPPHTNTLNERLQTRIANSVRRSECARGVLQSPRAAESWRSSAKSKLIAITRPLKGFSSNALFEAERHREAKNKAGTAFAGPTTSSHTAKNVGEPHLGLPQKLHLNHRRMRNVSRRSVPFTSRRI
jgi:hypothetical protein